MEGILEFAKQLGPWLAVLFAATVYVVAPVIRDRLKERYAKNLDRKNARHSAIIEINREYFRKRIDAYLAIWTKFTESSRALFAAGSYSSDTSWDDALQDLEDLSNYFYDNRPLVSRRVFHHVVELRELRRRYAADARTQSGMWERHRWQKFKNAIQRVQREVLAAIAADLEEQGLDQITVNIGATADGPTDENRLNYLVRFIVRGQAKHPFVGVQFLRKRLTQFPAKERDELLTQAQELGWVETYEFEEPGKPERIRAIRPVLSESRVRELVDGQVAVSAEAMMELHDWRSLMPGLLTYVAHLEAHPIWDCVAESQVARSFRALNPRGTRNLLNYAVKLNLIKRYLFEWDGGTTRAVRLTEDRAALEEFIDLETLDIEAAIVDPLGDDSALPGETSAEPGVEAHPRNRDVPHDPAEASMLAIPAEAGDRIDDAGRLDDENRPQSAASSVPSETLSATPRAPDPDQAPVSTEPGAVLRGVVSHCRQDYVLVVLETGSRGICHISTFRNVPHGFLAREFPNGKTSSWRVLAVHDGGGRIELAHAGSQSQGIPRRPFQSVRHGDVVEGEVVRSQQDYVLVRLHSGVTGLCHISSFDHHDPEILTRDFPVGRQGQWRVAAVDAHRERISLVPLDDE